MPPAGGAADDRHHHALASTAIPSPPISGIVSGEAILGANIFRDVFAGNHSTSSAAGRAPTRNRSPKPARRRCASLQERGGAELGANAVIGVDLDYEVINNMLMVSASGTAVRLD